MNSKVMMKWMMAAIVLMVFSSTMALAQPGGGRMNMNPKEMAKQTVTELTKQLKLDKGQQDSVYQYQLAQSEEMQKLFAAGRGGDREAMRAKMTELQENTDKKINSVLNDEQKEAYKKVQAERQNRGRMGGPGGGGRRGGGDR